MLQKCGDCIPISSSGATKIFDQRTGCYRVLLSDAIACNDGGFMQSGQRVEYNLFTNRCGLTLRAGQAAEHGGPPF